MGTQIHFPWRDIPLLPFFSIGVFPIGLVPKFQLEITSLLDCGQLILYIQCWCEENILNWCIYTMSGHTYIGFTNETDMTYFKLQWL